MRIADAQITYQVGLSDIGATTYDNGYLCPTVLLYVVVDVFSKLILPFFFAGQRPHRRVGQGSGIGLWRS